MNSLSIFWVSSPGLLLEALALDVGSFSSEYPGQISWPLMMSS